MASSGAATLRINPEATARGLLGASTGAWAAAVGSGVSIGGRGPGLDSRATAESCGDCGLVVRGASACTPCSPAVAGSRAATEASTGGVGGAVPVAEEFTLAGATAGETVVTTGHSELGPGASATLSAVLF